jgi:hypothetical protein
MIHMEFLIKIKVNGELANAKGGKVNGQSRAI